MPQKRKVLFVCTGNSCRSQMAEGWARRLVGDELEPLSAGLEPSELNPLAVRAMAEAGIDISGQSSKALLDVFDEEPDYVITVCDHARESCPRFPGQARVIHAGFDDPPHLARNARTDEEAMVHYRRVRDEIRDFVRDLPERLLRGDSC